MKPSNAILKGFAMAGEKQCTEKFFEGDSRRPTAVCAAGAYFLATTGDACPPFFFPCEFYDATKSLNKLLNTENAIGKLNNGWMRGQTEPMSIPDIAGILAAEGF